MGRIFLDYRMRCYLSVEYLVSPSIRLCSFRMGIGCRIRTDYPPFLYYRAEEISRGLSVERHGNLFGLCRHIVYHRRRSKHCECIRTLGVQYLINTMLRRIYPEERPFESE